MLMRTNYFRIKFNSYQHAYFTTVAKNYKFCLNLLTEWLYYYIRDLDEQSLKVLDYQFRRFGYKKCIRDFPQKLFELCYRRLPSSIAQNIFPEALALAKARLNKSQDEFHFKVSSFSFTWTDLKDKIQVLKFPRSRYLKQYFKDPVELRVPDNVYNHVIKQTKHFHVRIIFKDGTWWCYIIKKSLKKEKSPNKKRVFAGIDLNLNDIAYIDEVSKQPILFSLKQVSYKCFKLFEKSTKLQSQSDRYKKYLKKITSHYKNVFKIYSIRIIQYAKLHGINRIAIGDVQKTLKKKELSRIVRKFWNRIPWSYFVDYLISYGEKHGIYVYMINEAYTSKCSALTNDINKKKPTYSGKRIARGLYKHSDGTVINSDVNGAANILKKAAYNFNKVLQFTKHQLSAVRRVGFQLLSRIRLDIVLFWKKLKDINGAGYQTAVTPLKPLLLLFWFSGSYC